MPAAANWVFTSATSESRSALALSSLSEITKDSVPSVTVKRASVGLARVASWIRPPTGPALPARICCARRLTMCSR